MLPSRVPGISATQRWRDVSLRFPAVFPPSFSFETPPESSVSSKHGKARLFSQRQNLGAQINVTKRERTNYKKKNIHNSADTPNVFFSVDTAVI